MSSASPLTWFKVVAVALAVVLSGSACAESPDDRLAHGWTAMADPVAWRPTVGACHNQFASPEATAPCSAAHRYQTVYVGEITGPAAALGKPPTSVPDGYQGLRAECDARLSAFLGGPWHERKIRLVIGFPSTGGWTGGSRWYSCEAGPWNIIDDYAEATWSMSLKGGFESFQQLRFGCYHASSDNVIQASACNEAHNTEFAGTFQFAEMSYEDMRVQRSKPDNPVDRKCQEVVATFAGASRVPTGTWVWDPAWGEWHDGDRTMRCFLWLGTTTVAKSLRGVGASGWPLRS